MDYSQRMEGRGGSERKMETSQREEVDSGSSDKEKIKKLRWFPRRRARENNDSSGAVSSILSSLLAALRCCWLRQFRSETTIAGQ